MVTECDVTKLQNLRRDYWRGFSGEVYLHERTLTFLTSSSKIFYMHRDLLNSKGK